MSTDSLTVREYAEQYWLPLLPRRVGLRTREEYEKRWRTQLVGEFGDVGLTQLTRGEVRDWLRRLLREGYAVETIKTYLRTLQAVYRQALNDEIIEHSPTQLAGSGLLISSKPTPARLTPAQVNAMLAAADPFECAAFGVAFRTGLRRAELAGLQVDDVRGRRLLVRRQYLGNSVVVGETKHGGTRWVDLSTHAAALLRDRVAISTTWLFCLPGHVWPACPATLYKRYRKLTRRVGIPATRLHGTRHTFASRLLEVSGDLVYVKTQMGHRDIKITERYTVGAEPPARLDLVDRLDDGLVDVPVRRPPHAMRSRPQLRLVRRPA